MTNPNHSLLAELPGSRQLQLEGIELMRLLLIVIFGMGVPCAVHAADPNLVDALRGLDARVIIRGQVRQPPLASMLSRDAEAGLRIANAAE